MNSQVSSNFSGYGAVLSDLPRTQRIIRMARVRELTGLSRATIYDRLNPASRRYDPSFPKQINLGGQNSRATAVGWIEAEVLAWVQQCRRSGTQDHVA
jgi:prophage regulatory protein